MSNIDFFDQAKQADLDLAVVVGLDREGKLHLYLNHADRERLVVLLERAKSRLVRSLDD